MINQLKKLGPGLLFAGAAIGVSHLVQSTKAGANFGFGLLWALLLINIVKYPFYQFGPRYAAATGESLLDGYKKLSKGALIAYYVITFATMFTIQMAVTIVTAGLANALFGELVSVEVWAVIILGICLCVLLIGKYNVLDKLIKVIIVILTISTIASVGFAIFNTTHSVSFAQILPKGTIELTFLIAFMGWMPAPLDISIWHSLWTVEKQKTEAYLTPKSALFDFNIGYIGTVILGVGFITLGALIMFNSGKTFSNVPGIFANQLIDLYTSSLGNWSTIIIGIAAFTTMFSTTLTTLDASPRAMDRTTELLFNNTFSKGYLFWIVLLVVGTLTIYFFSTDMSYLIKIATVLSFLTAPFYAILNYILICSKNTPKEWQPSKTMTIYSLISIVFLIVFSSWYLSSIL